MIKRINLIGGPGSGKSTMAAHVFAHFKMRGYDIELVQEYVKSWAYEKQVVKAGDQIMLLAKQHRRELIPLRNGVRAIVTDSPLCLTAFYGQNTMKHDWELLWAIAKSHERDYESLNIFLERPTGPYVQCGRYQTEAEAIEVDTSIKKFLDVFKVPFIICKHSNVLHLVESSL